MVLAAVVLTVASASALWSRTSDKKVKATATADKADADGKQVVHITLEIDPAYHLYANPVDNEMFEPTRTTVTITSKNKPESLKIDYPPGEVMKLKEAGEFKVYKGKVTIKATVQRARGDSEPLEVEVKVYACDKDSCLPPGNIKLTVP
jgi:DsbC/DsbD-like thiol-disulfide interchange protein